MRKLVDERFQHAPGWTKKQTGDVDWTKGITIDGARVRLGVEIRFAHGAISSSST